MRYATFGPLSVSVPLVGQGTWNLERDDPEIAIEALRAGIDAGMTHIDTAELYGSGRVERLLRDVIRDRRDELFIVSKVLPQNAAYHDVLKACDRSLERLGTDRLDLYLLHWRGAVPLEETFRAFDSLEQAGKIRAWGVSNFDVDDLEEAIGIAGENRIACNQVLYHLAERSIEQAVVPWCRAHRAAVVAYSPFGSGRFPSRRSEGGKALETVAHRYDATVRQVALAFLIQRSGVFAIPKAARPEHAIDNAYAADIELDDAAMRTIDAAFPVKPKRRLPSL